MSITADDLTAQPFTIEIKGKTLQAKPVKMRHALIMAKLGNIFNNLQEASDEDIERADKKFTEIIEELIPELKGVDLDMQTTVDILGKLMESVEPTDNQELKKSGVTFDDPKAPKSEGGST